MHFPKPPLDRHVESLTFYAGFAPTHQREKLIPDGAIQIIVDLTDRPKKLYASETGSTGVDFRRAWISGMHRRWIVIEAQQQASMLIIRFRPGGALAFVRHNAEALSDTVFSLADVLSERAAISLRDRILAAPDIPAKFAATEGWLLEQAAGELLLNPSVVYLARRLSRPMGLKIRDLVAETGFSERHVLSLFRRWIGVSPKQFARIARFGGMLRSLAPAGAPDPALAAAPLQPPDWAQLATAAGYADQSHLSHEFRAFAGMTPGAYAAAYRGLNNYLPITLAHPE